MSTPNTRYEATTRVCTVFFSALIGFALSHMLQEPQPPQRDFFGADRQPCFLIALLLFLRFLFGSANHIWLEYVYAPSNPKRRNFLILDIIWLIVFGDLALRICFATGIHSFLFWNSAFGGTVIASILLGLLIRYFLKCPSEGRWHGWWRIDLIQMLAAILVRWFYRGTPRQPPSYAAMTFGSHLLLDFLVAGYVAMLVWDLIFQLDILDQHGNSGTNPSAPLIASPPAVATTVAPPADPAVLHSSTPSNIPDTTSASPGSSTPSSQPPTS